MVKIRPVGAELFYADGQTGGRRDMKELTVAFRNFANALKNMRRGQDTEVMYSSCKYSHPFHSKHRYTPIRNILF